MGVSAKSSVVTVGTTAVQLVTANIDRKQLLVFGPAYFGGSDVTTTNGFLAESPGISLVGDAAKTSLYGVSLSSGNPVSILELIES